MKLQDSSKTKKLVLGIVFDALGFVSYIFPPFDIFWAPASAYLMTKLYKSREGKIAAIISFVEEALPIVDFIPSFTLMWLYTYIFKSKPNNTTTEVK